MSQARTWLAELERPGRLSPGLVTVLLLLFLLGVLTVGIQALVTSRVQFGADFHTFWVAARALFLERLDPYSPEVNLRSQLGIYGRAPLPGEDPLGFAYPPYSLFLVLPAVPMPYPWAQAFWIALNLTLLMGAAIAAFPGLRPWVLGTLVFFYPAGYGMIIGNFAVTLAAFLIIVYAILRRRNSAPASMQFAAGCLLAWVTIKPQVTWLLVVFTLIYSARYRLWHVWGGFAGALAFFLAATLWMLPGWPLDWLNQVFLQADEVRFFEPLALAYAGWFTPPGLSSWAAAALVLAAVGATAGVVAGWWRGRSPDWAPLACIVLVTQLVHPLILSPDQVIIALPLLMWVTGGVRRPRRAADWIWAGAVILPWILFFFPVVVLDSYELTMYWVTKGPPLLFGLWTLWLLWKERWLAGWTDRHLPESDQR